MAASQSPTEVSARAPTDSGTDPSGGNSTGPTDTGGPGAGEPPDTGGGQPGTQLPVGPDQPGDHDQPGGQPGDHDQPGGQPGDHDQPGGQPGDHDQPGGQPGDHDQPGTHNGGSCEGEGGPGEVYEVGGSLVCFYAGPQDHGSQEVHKSLAKSNPGADADQLWKAFGAFVKFVNAQRLLEGLPPLKGLPGVSFAVWSTEFNLCLRDYSCVMKRFPQLLAPSQSG
ncbi:hypothetical protein ACFT38_48550 [Streptomyces sp. NPDC056975]|uniref:hypothetical protein n=1 Tax=Streptomyces sp. NPDC056975 TaxID=3345985 RepID=UPI003633369B